MNAPPRVITEHERKWGYVLPEGYPNQIISHQETRWSGLDLPPVPPTAAPLNRASLVSCPNKDIMNIERDRVESVEREPHPNPYLHDRTFVGDGLNDFAGAREGQQGPRPTLYLHDQTSVGDGLNDFAGA